MSPSARQAPPHRSTSGIEIAAGLRPADLDATRRQPRPSASPAPSVHPGHPARLATAAGRGRCASTPGSGRRRRRIGASATSSTAGQTGLSRRVRSADPDGIRLGRPVAASARSAAWACRSTRSPTWSSCSTASIRARSRTSMTINATAAILLTLYETVARRRGVDPRALRGTIQNDILKEYIARGTYIFPPGPSMRLVTDTFAYCRAELPSWNTISISGYHMREAGATAVQEVAFTVANAIAYADAALARGAGLRRVRPAPLASSSPPTTISSRRSRSSAPRGESGRRWRGSGSAPKDPRSMAMRFHVQTGGSTLTAQQPDVNVVRTTVQALSAVLGGAQSLHTNALDEALGLPTPSIARLALRTQQVLYHESGVARDRRPAGWLLLRRDPDRRDRHARAMAELDGDRRSRGHAGRPRRRLPAGRDRRRGVRRAAGRRGAASGSSSGVNAFADEGDGAASRAADDRSRTSRRRQVERTRGRPRSPRRGATADDGVAALDDARPREPRTCCRASAPASRPT